MLVMNDTRSIIFLIMLNNREILIKAHADLYNMVLHRMSKK